MRTFVRSSFDDPDTVGVDATIRLELCICDEDEIVETQVVTGIAYSKDGPVPLRRVADISRASRRPCSYEPTSTST